MQFKCTINLDKCITVLDAGKKHHLSYKTLRNVIELYSCILMMLSSIEIYSGLHEQQRFPYTAVVNIPSSG